MEFSRAKTVKEDSAGPSSENTNIICDPCRNDGENINAEGYCVECEEYLCKDCYKVHCRPSVTRHHVLQEKDSMPRKRTSKPEMCPIHVEQPIEYYCVTHEEVCCTMCRSMSHEKCENVKPINDMLHEADMEKEFSELQGKIKILQSDIDSTQYLVQTNLKAIAINHDNSREEMDTLRTAIREHIDQIENELDIKLKTIRNEDEGKITSYKNACNAMHFDINAVESYIEGKRSGNKKYDLFIAMKKAQSKIKSNHIDLRNIRAKNKVRRYQFSPEHEVKKLQSHPIKFGSFSNKDEALKTERFVSDIEVKSNKDTQTCYITGTSLISETLLAIADNKNKNVKLIHTKINKITAEACLKSPPWDITTVPDNKIVVTIPSEERIQFLSVPVPHGDAISLEKSVNVAGKCYGVDFIRQEGKLIVSYCYPGKIEILNLDGTLDRKVDLELNNPIYISAIPNTNTAWISDPTIKDNKYENGCVRYVNFGKQQKQLFKIDMIGFCQYPIPLGLATDKSGTTYACNYQNQILVFSPVDIDKNRTQTINVKADVLIKYSDKKISPRSITFCNKSFRLYVGMYGDKMKVYSVA
ncbi:uncharacterized protein LOC128548138 [Mercenaria mercenaria]|uniref:uncharacterized protein LOC128548138 n=1 Tax=Mercenaria mercenaria TaxID=6596 RepID=UPI00234E7E06|nr:uncharacterized protein LOC128548138 [Mercenaria mercenaria]